MDGRRGPQYVSAVYFDRNRPTLQTTNETDLQHYLAMLWRGRWLLLATLIVVPVAAYVLTSRLPKDYQASTLMSVGPSIDTSLQPGFAPSSTTGSDLQVDARLLSTTAMSNDALHFLPSQPGHFSSLAGVKSVSGSADPMTNFLTISVTADNPRLAADAANAYGQALIGRRTVDARNKVAHAVANLIRQQNQLPRGDTVDREKLSGQLAQLRALGAAQNANASVIEPASPPGSAVSPHVGRNTELGVIGGLLLGFLLVMLRDRLDRRLHDPLELEQHLAAPLLTILPEGAFTGAQPTPAVIEAFQTLRTSLTYFRIDRPITTIVVTSGAKNDGKTVVASNLARAFASAGKDVILVDADLRGSVLAKRVGYDAEHGLGSVLVGAAPLDQVLVEIDTGGEGRLRILPAGPPPPNPSQLVGSEQMDALIAELTERSDYVVLDSPPLLAVSDALPLVKRSSGTIIVARLDRTSRDGLKRARQLVEAAGGKILGGVATGIAPARAYAYGYGYQYGVYGQQTANGSSSKRRGGFWGRLGPARAAASTNGHAEASGDQQAQPAPTASDGQTNTESR